MRPFAFCCGTGDEREPGANILRHPWPALVASPVPPSLSSSLAEGSRPETNCENYGNFYQSPLSSSLSRWF